MDLSDMLLKLFLFVSLLSYTQGEWGFFLFLQRKPCKLCWMQEAAAERSRKADSLDANRRDQQGLLVMKRTAPFFTVLLLANKCYIASKLTLIRAAGWNKAMLLSYFRVLSLFLLSGLCRFCCYGSNSGDSHCYEKMVIPTPITDR